MRPDALSWRNTSDMAAMQFTPRQLIYRRVLVWIIGIVALHTLVGLLIWYALQLSLIIASPPGAGDQAAGPRPLSFSSLTSMAGEVRGLSHVAAALFGSFLVVMLLVVPLIRSTLRRHALGLQELFKGIRDMASGNAPKPLSAGQPGEVGYLALAFNDMTSKLLASRKELLEANQMLERRVEGRTRELREAAAKLDQLASTDSLTGLANRRALTEQGQVRFDTTVSQGKDLVCFLLDMDNFKKVNDTLGHKAGDELIRMLADTLRNACHAEDLTARLGGDEFTVVLSPQTLAAAATLAQRIQTSFNERVVPRFGGRGLEKLPSVSIGIASRKTAAAASFEELMTSADAALYRAKEAGKGRFEIYKPAQAA